MGKSDVTSDADEDRGSKAISRRWGRTITLVLLALFGIIALMLFVGADMQESKRNEKLIRSVDANDSTIAFTTSLGKGENGVAVYDLQKKNWFILSNPGGYVGSPKLSTINPKVLFVSVTKPDQHPKEKGGNYKIAKRTLMKCHIEERRCERVFSLQQNINEPIEIPGQGLMFISGPPKISADRFAPDRAFIRFVKNDFYLRRPDGEIQRLTNIEYVFMGSVNLLENRIIFNAAGPGKIVPRDMLPPKRSATSATSEIFQIRFGDSVTSMKMDASVFVPIVKIGTFWNAQPSAAKGSPFLAFLNKNSGKNENYNLAVYDMDEKKLIDTVKAHSLQSMSRSSVTKGGHVVYYEYYDDAYRIIKYSIKDKSATEVGRISVSDITKAKAKAINIAE